jgi:hypothetical protein
VQLWPLDLRIILWEQFHPEADPVSFVSHLRNKEAKEKNKMKGEKFKIMLEDLMDDDKIYSETLIQIFFVQP